MRPSAQRYDAAHIERDPVPLAIPDGVTISAVRFDASGQYAIGGFDRSMLWRLDTPSEVHDLGTITSALWVD